VKFPEIEERILKYWDQDGTFQASIDQRSADAPGGQPGSNEFVFYDGPPFANGLPHYGHLLTGYAKDLVGRYQTQRGRRVERRFGWDTHGLPAELEAMPAVPRGHVDGFVSFGSLYAGPPVPSPRGSPPWTTKPGTIR
jgi:isoleucyl-tRNA synthetase